MANITDIAFEVCPKCGSSTIVRQRVAGYQYASGEWEDGVFIIDDTDTEYDTEGDFQIVCDGYGCDYIAPVSPQVDWA